MNLSKITAATTWVRTNSDAEIRLLCRTFSALVIFSLLLSVVFPVPTWAYKLRRPSGQGDEDLRLTADGGLGDSSKRLLAEILGLMSPLAAATVSKAWAPETSFDTETLERSVKDISTPIANRDVVIGEIISLAAIPVGRNGAPIHGLAPVWRSSDPSTIRIINGSQALAQRPGHAQLIVSAGEVKRAFQLSVGGSSNAGSGFVPPPDEPIITEQQAINLTSPENNIGNPPGQSEMPGLVPAAAARTRERHGSANYSFDLLAASLPGRGINASVNITYNSRVWNRTQYNGFLSFVFNTDGNWLAPGFSIGFGSIQGYQTLTGYGYLLTAPDGTRTQLIEKQSSGNCTKHESTDGSFIETNTCDGYDAPSLLLRYPNGARVTYGALMQDGKRYPVTMQDRNGNYITITYIDGAIGGKVFSVRDTLNRYIGFHYDNSPAQKLIATTVPGLEESSPRQTIRFYYETISLQTAGRFHNTAEVIAPTSVDVVRYVYFPGTQSGFRYDYSPYFGVIHKISQMRGMQVSTNSLGETGSVISEGTCAAWTHYNYPSTAMELGAPLMDVPQFTWRKDDWLGRTTEIAQTWYSSVESVTPAGCQTGEGNCTGTRTTTITSPDGTRNVSISLIRPASDWQNGLLSEAMVVSGDGANQTVWSRSKFYWQQGSDQPAGRDDPRVEKVEVTNDANQTRATSFGYDGYNNRTVIREHDFAQPGTLGPELQRSEITYETGTGWINNRLLRLPVRISSIVGGVEVSKIVYKYDDYSTSPLTNTPGVMQHVEAYNPHTTGTHPCNCHWECSAGIYNTGEQRCSDGSPPVWVCDEECPNYDPATVYRGNVTKVIAFPDIPASEEDPDNAVTTFKYDITGNVRETGASCCRQDSFTYAESSGYAYPVQRTSGSQSQLTTKTVYDRNTGLVKATTDENDQTTVVAYDPSSLRAIRVDGPDGAWSKLEYNDLVFPYYVKSSSSLDVNRSVSVWAYSNGRGQQFRNRSRSAHGYLSRDVEYDVIGRASKSFNPYTVTDLAQERPSEIKFTATTQRDGLGRPLSIRLPDNTTASATYSGLIFTATDQTGKSRRRITDALGRIVRVDEPGSNGSLGPVSAPVQPTHYEYDGNSNLTRVTQFDGTVTQDRRFRYDRLSRLTHERQVEAVATLNDDGVKIGTNGVWTGVFKYDNENHLVEAVDSRGVKTSIEYDGLNRVTAVTYTGEIGYQTPTVTYTYDEFEQGYLNKGRLTKVNTAPSAQYGLPETIQTYRYDKVGRIRKHSQSIGNKTYELEYDYNLAGQLVREKYPSGRVFRSGVDDLGVTQTIADSQRTYLNGVTISNKGQLAELLLGNGTKETFLQNDRLQMASHSLVRGVEILQRHDYSFGVIDDLSNGEVDPTKNNGQVSRVDSYIGSSLQWSQRVGYDHLGRLKEVREYEQGDNSRLTYRQAFDFDRYGNLYRKASSNPTDGQSDPLPTTWIEDADIDRATNRFTAGITYDERGNVLTDNKFRSVGFSYDANSRLVGVTRPNQSDARTVYDGTGNRVAEKIDGVWRHLIYDVFGHLIAEYGVASEGAGGVKYLHQDLQGSIRAVTNASGFVVSRTDHQAHGEAIDAGVGLRSTEQGYAADTGFRHGYGRLEKDVAAGVSHAWFRKLETQAGRWTSPDPYLGSMSLSDPQSFNRYSYVTNDPLNYTDPAGLYEACVHEAMTKYIGRLANMAPLVADTLAGYTGDGEGGADSFAYAATNPENVAKCSLGAGPTVTVHFPSSAQLRTNVQNFRKYLNLGLQGYDSYYQLAGFALHSIQDALGAHSGYSNRLCKGHARHGSAPDRLIGDDKFIAAANKVLQVMSGDPNAKLTSEQVKELIKKVLEACKGTEIKVAPQPGSGGGGGGGGGISSGGGGVPGYSQMPWWYSSMWSYLDEIDAIELGGGTVTVEACVGSDCA